MRRAAGLLVVAALAGCGARQHVVASTCTDGPGAVVRALARIPGRVVLADGTRLSDCVSEAIGDADLQNVGASFSAAAARLARGAERETTTAERLGFLVGATERGSDRTSGFAAELVFRMRAFVASGRMSGEQRAAAERGRAEGLASG